jgi:hypothetical protein
MTPITTPARKNPAHDLVDAIQPVIELLYVHNLASEQCVGQLVAARGRYVRRCLMARGMRSIKPHPDQLPLIAET